MDFFSTKSKMISVAILSVLIGLHFHFISALHLPKKDSLESEETGKLKSENITKMIVIDDSKRYKHEINLETVKTKLNNEELYENVSEKDNNVSERSFIFIQGSKFKVPYLNALTPLKLQEKKNYKTFVSNIGPVEFIKYDEVPPRFHAPPLIDTVAEIKNTHNNYYSASDPFYIGPLNNYIEHEMNLLSDKVNAANGVIGLQYQDSKLKNDLINMHTKFPGLMYTNHNGRYPKDSQIKMKLKSGSKKDRMFNGDKILNKDMDLKYEPRRNQQQYVTVNIMAPLKPPLPTAPDAMKNEIKPFSGYKLPNEPFPEDSYRNDAREMNLNNKQEERREFIELMKAPLLRSNIELTNNVFKRFKKPYVENDKNSEQVYNHNQPNVKRYKPNVPFRMKNELRMEKNVLPEEIHKEGRKGPAPNKFPDLYQQESNEEPEFQDSRLMNKLNEIQDIDDALTADKQREYDRNGSDKNRYFEDPAKEDKNQELTKYPKEDKCVYPGCEYYKSNPNKLVDKCKCPSEQDKSVTMSPSSYSLVSAEVTPVDINTIRQFGH